MLLINEVLKIFRIEFGGEENIIPISLLLQENIIDVLEKKPDQNIFFFQLAEEAGDGSMKLLRMQKF